MFYLALVLLKLLAIPLSLLPRQVFLALGRALGGLLFLLGFRVKIARANIKLAFPEWEQERQERLLRDHFQELGVLFLELLRMFYRFDRFFDLYADVEGHEPLQRILDEGGKGVFVFTSHIGNWEVLTLSGRRVFGRTSVMVTKELKPAWLHRVVGVTRSLLGVEMANEPRTMRGVMRGLKQNNLVGWVMDQYAGAPVGARVPFFGKPVGSHTALAALALRTGTPVIPAVAVRKPDGRYLVRFGAPVQLLERVDRQASVIANTALFVRLTEATVREFPAQWLWIHRRWKGDLSPLPPQAEGEMLK
jgi:KDO2-lipid IV(A) lauroyltransferase